MAYFVALLLSIVGAKLFIYQFETRDSDKLSDPLNQAYVDQWVHWHRFAYPAISGASGAQSVLFAKCTVELLVNWTAGRGTPWYNFGTYLVIAGMACTISLQISWLNEGLKRYKSFTQHIH